VDIARDMEELCPNALFLQYTNPMAMNCWAIFRATKIKTVGLCHSVQGTAWELARDLGIPVEEINFLCAGINHMAFYLRFEHNGRCEEQTARWESDRVKYEGPDPLQHKRTSEYGSLIIHSMETNVPRVIYGNVPNRSLIDNLPNGCCVEVPCLVDKQGIQPTK